VLLLWMPPMTKTTSQREAKFSAAVWRDDPEGLLRSGFRQSCSRQWEVKAAEVEGVQANSV